MDADLQQATSYTYHITAVNDAGQESLPSDDVVGQTRGDAVCRSFQATLAEHAAQDRAHIDQQCFGWWCWFWPYPKTDAYYAVGSEEFLGLNGSTSVVLYSRDGHAYSKTDCADP